MRITLVIIILVLVIICIWSISRKDYFEKEIEITLAQMAKIANNGDLLFLSGSSPSEKFCKKVISSPFTHVGILFREKHPETGEDILYIFDSDIGQSSKEGVRIMPLKQKLIKYKGYKIGGLKRLIILDKLSRPTTQNILDIVPKYLDKKFDSKLFWRWIGIINNSEGVFCSELTALILQDLKILEPNKPASSYSPKDFENNNLDLTKGYSYGNTLLFSFDHKD